MAATRDSQAVGNITLRDKTTSEIVRNIPISPTTGDVDSDINPSYLIPAATPIFVVGMGGIDTAAKIIHIRARDNTTKSARSVTITLTKTDASTFSFIATEFMYVASENANLKAISITVQATGNETEIDVFAAGT